jgi:alpha-L-rhamnosidase
MYSLFSFFANPRGCQNEMVEIQTLTFEHHREALGIGESEPRLSWSFKGDAKDWTQTSYEVEISRPLKNSGKAQPFHVKSSQSALVPWPTTPLKSKEYAKVRVRAIGGSKSEPTPWSETVAVETGLLTHEDWTATLIGAERIKAPSGALRPILFRKSFDVKDTIKSARLYITSQGAYEPYINGTRVGDHVLAPGWRSYKHHLNYQTFDVTSLLKIGQNAIGVEVGEGWYTTRLGFAGGRRNIYGDRLALLAQLELVFEDGKTTTINSDKSWKSSVGPRIASEIYDGETYDASLEIKGWSRPSYDDKNWAAVEPMAFPTAKLQSPTGPPVRKTEIVKSQKIFSSPTGKTIIDFGQNLVGWLKVHASGPKGQTITFTHTEVLEHGEVATRPLRDCKAVDHLILSDESITWEPAFTFHGFRYVQVENWPSGSPKESDIEAVVLHTDMEQTGWFNCSDSMINKLHQNIQWGMRGNFLSIPTDCPQRDERLGWTGDIQVFSPTASFLYDTFGMLSGWLKDLAAEQTLDYNGVTPLVVPNIINVDSNTPQAAWGDVAVILPYDLYTAFGDKEILRAQSASMKAWLEDGIPREANGLWDPKINQLGDWLDPDAPPTEPSRGKTDPHLVANAYLAHISAIMAKVSQILDLKDDAKHYSAEATKIKKLFQAKYMTPSGRLAPETMTSLSLALTYDLFPTSFVKSAAADRLAAIVQSSRFRIGTGFVGTPLICPALSSTGYTQLAYRMLLETKCPSWLYPITMGATTMWERWDSMLPDGSINMGEMTSFNHYALGSVGAWLHSTVGGVSPEVGGEGWKVVRFEPVPGGTVRSAETRYKGPYGDVECKWRLQGGKFKMTAKVPPNSKGVVKLPGVEEVKSVGSGTHEFEAGYKELD